MNELIAIAGALGFISNICTIWMFTEDRIDGFRQRKRKKKMVPERKDG